MAALSRKLKPSDLAFVLTRREPRRTSAAVHPRRKLRGEIQNWQQRQSQRREVGSQARGEGGGGETSGSSTESNAFPREVATLFKSLFQPKEDEAVEKNVAAINIDSDEGLGGTSDGVFGPDAMLTVGFTKQENLTLRDMMLEMEADFVKLIACEQGMMSEPLVNIFTKYDGNINAKKREREREREGKEQRMGIALEEVKITDSGAQQRTIILSGMSGAEVNEIVNAYYELGLGDAAFAALVPNNQDTVLSELLDEVHEDHRLYNQQGKP